MTSWPNSLAVGPRRVLAASAALAVVVAIALAIGLAAGRTAAHRATIGRLDRAVAARSAEIDALRTDYEVRSRLPELDRWGAGLGLAAPSADQFATGGTLAATAAARRQELRDGVAVRPATVAGYPTAARAELDDLVDAVDGG